MTHIRGGYVWMTSPVGGFMELRKARFVETLLWKYLKVQPKTYK